MAEIVVEIVSDISEIAEADWDALANPEGGRPQDPFTTHRFLRALELSGSVGGRSGWYPRYFTARSEGVLVGAAPCYLKAHSQGEYIFDHAWAEALERAGGAYYPKLQCAVPFTPVTGRRLFCAAGYEAALLGAMREVVDNNDLSSAHLTFCTEAEMQEAARAGYLTRITQQFHWHNRGYETYDDFLAQLSSRKRKALKKERAQAQAGVAIRALSGEAIEPAHWDAFWLFYQDTGARKWGRPYLTRAFFDLLHEMREDVLLVLAFQEGEPVAGALNLIGREALFGRYWGCLESHPALHFELCYHQAIEYAIKNRLSRVEAGAQGEHKLARGYLPVPTYSAHYIAHEGLRGAVARYLEEERAAISEEIAAYREISPYRSEAG